MNSSTKLNLSQDSIQWNQQPQQQVQQQEQQKTYHDKISNLSDSTDHVPTENKSISSRVFSWVTSIDIKATLATAGGIILGISLIILGIIKNHQTSQPINPFFPSLGSIPDLVIEKGEKVEKEEQSIDVTQKALSAEPVVTPVVTQPAEVATEIPQQAPSVFEALSDQKVERVDNKMMRNRAGRQANRRPPTTALRDNVKKMTILEPTAPLEKPVEKTTASPAPSVNSRANSNIGNRIAHLQQQGGIKFQLPRDNPNPRKPAQSQEDQSSQVDGAV